MSRMLSSLSSIIRSPSITTSLLKLTKSIADSATMVSLSKKYQASMGYRKLGLRLDDLIPDENGIVQEAIHRLSVSIYIYCNSFSHIFSQPREYQDRIYRFRRALLASSHQDDLPKEEWTTEEDVCLNSLLLLSCVCRIFHT